MDESRVKTSRKIPNTKNGQKKSVDPIFVKPTRSEMRPMFRVRKRAKRLSHPSQKQFPRCEITFASFSDTFRGNLPARNRPPFPAHIQHTIHVHKNQGFLAVENAQAMPRAALLDFFLGWDERKFQQVLKTSLEGKHLYSWVVPKKRTRHFLSQNLY